MSTFATLPEQGDFVSPNDLRREFSSRLSAMYAAEVPLYGELVRIVREVNERVIREHPELGLSLEDLDHLSEERHGAIRLGKPEEMEMMARVFGILGMQPVNFYDLTDAGAKSQPVISTAFRPIDLDDIEISPFRVFTSLLQPDDRRFFDEWIGGRIKKELGKRNIFSPRIHELVDLAEKQGGLTREQADDFLQEATQLFSWAGTARADDLYVELINPTKLNRPIAADICCFSNPHLNHLTPSSLDIDLLYETMERILAERDKAGEKMKGSIEGPPKRKALILLRQTSYQALTEQVTFTREYEREHLPELRSTHQARFGEIEQRGVALTPEGRELYDQALAESMAIAEREGRPANSEEMATAFAIIPDGHAELRAQGLAYYTYHTTDRGREATGSLPNNLETLVDGGHVEFRPIRYEDFLPVSAAGIFASNLGTGEHGTAKEAEAEKQKSPYSVGTLAKIMGREIISSYALYAAQQAASLQKAFTDLGIRMEKALEEDVRRAIDDDPSKSNGRSK